STTFVLHGGVMGLIDDVRAVCRRLADTGWRDAFGMHGLNVEAADLAAELARPLAIQRGAPGLSDLAPNATRAIEPGSLAGSLLYHLLASPDAVMAAVSSNTYPTLAELDTIENYVFAAAKRKLSDFELPIVAVFAYQYRVGFRTAHGLH